MSSKTSSFAAKIREKTSLPSLLEAVLETGGCDQCEAKENDLWVMEDDPTMLLHGFGDEVGECENQVLHELHRRGLLEIHVAKKCPKGHEWYGEGCPECGGEPSPY